MERQEAYHHTPDTVAFLLVPLHILHATVHGPFVLPGTRLATRFSKRGREVQVSTTLKVLDPMVQVRTQVKGSVALWQSGKPIPVGRWSARLQFRMDHRHGLIDGWLHVRPL